MAENALSGLAPLRPGGAGGGIRRMCAECEEEEGKNAIRRRTLGGRDGHGGTQAPPEVSRLIAQPGRLLERSARGDFEARFKSSFDHVTVHDGPAADEAARSIGARAFTSGSSIVFAQGQYAPATDQGRRLLAHELAHVVQNGSPSGARPIRRDPVDYTKMTIDQLRKHLKVKAAVEELLSRFEKMSNVELARYAAGDELAAIVYAKRIVVPVEAAGQGSFSSKGVHEKLAADIKADRGASGVPRSGPSAVQPDLTVEGGTVGSARTDIPGLQDKAFVGRSPRAGGAVNPASEFPPATAMNKLPQTFGHAEQNIADSLDAALQKIPREQLAGRKVWMLIEQEPCSTCAQGATGAETAAGVLKKLSLKYPEITFEIKSLESSSIIVLKGGASPAAAGGAASGTSGKSVQVDTKIEVTKSVQTPEGTTISEVEYVFGKGIEEVNAGAPAGSTVPGKVLVRVTQNADGSIAAVESLSGQPQAMVEALAHKTLGGAGTDVAAAAEGAGAGTAAAGARMALLFKGLKIGGTAAFAIITAYQLWNATPKERPRILAGAAGGFAGGMAASYVACNLLFGIETLGWSLLFCGLVAGGAGGYLGSKGGEALYDAATATELDEALKLLEAKHKNQIGTFNVLVARMASDGCVDAQFVRDFISILPPVTDTEAVLIAAQLTDAPIQPAAPVKKVAPRSFPAYSGSGGGEVVCPGCHGRPMKDLVPPTMSPADIEAWKTMPTCTSVRQQGLAALRKAVSNLPPKAAPKTPLKPLLPAPGPFDHKSPPGYAPPAPAPSGFPSEKEQLGTVCPNCHGSTNAPKTWQQFGSGLSDPKKELSDMDRKRLIEWIQAQPK